MVQPSVILARSDAATEAVGQSLAATIAGGDVVLLNGDLAAGKTTLVRGLVRGLGGRDTDVSSPTFVIVQTYPCPGPISAVHHIDLYRLPDRHAALREIGIEDFLGDMRALIAIEWPRDLLEDWLPPGCRVWSISISRLDDDTRRIEISAPEEIAANG